MQMLGTMVERGVTPENVAAMTALVELKERMDARQAERDFAAAFVALQAEMPRIEAAKAVPNKDGTVRYHFAPFEDIMGQLQPLLVKHGFSVSFDNKFDGPRAVATCIRLHNGGHSKENSFAARIGSGPPGSSEAQSDGAAASYAKRFALCNAFNIVVKGLDDDARAHGSPLDERRVNELKGRVLDVKADEAAFLKYAGAANYDGIPAERYPMLDAMLSRKEIAAGMRDKEGNWLEK